ncbi:MAG TPA: proline--tRNA ligase [Candidatus Woesearchaeota archaeon]|nr:proline--tRNA ligase [Candidatus Woesearchaeota archaeon]
MAKKGESNEVKSGEKGITVKKSEDISEWYSQVILKAGVADYAPIKGCMVIRPLGYSIWTRIQDYFNQVLESYQVENAYFPLFVPESFFKREAEHAEGFSPEVAWIERKDLSEERLALRPTSETIMYHSYSKWIRSWRDLPLKINQWCNIIRWETNAVKLFLRSREFLWQEGHCVYETEEECIKEADEYIKEYKNLCESLLAIPVKIGRKTDSEKFAGAVFTNTMEALMPDGKATQLGTTHHLGQNFSKAFDIEFLGKDSQKHYPFQNSWGFSTRLVGSMIMLHSDDKGLVLPPKAAPIQVVIIPIFREDAKEKVLAEAEKLRKSLSGIKVKVDSREGLTPGWKFNEWELKGVPVRIELGMRDIENHAFVACRRDSGEKQSFKLSEAAQVIPGLLDEIQKSLFEKAVNSIEKRTKKTADFVEMVQEINKGNWVEVPFCGEKPCEADIREKTEGITSRVITGNISKEQGETSCINCSKKARYFVIFSRAY